MKKNLFLVKKWEHEFKGTKKEVLQDKKYEEAILLDEEENIIRAFTNKDEALSYFNCRGFETRIRESRYIVTVTYVELYGIEEVILNLDDDGDEIDRQSVGVWLTSKYMEVIK